MKVTFKEEPKQEQAKPENKDIYPCLKVDPKNEAVILFTAPKTGVFLHPVNPKTAPKPESPAEEFLQKVFLEMAVEATSIGTYSQCFDEDRLVKLDGDFVLSDLGDKKYPQLKITKDKCIVLFSSDSTGVCLEKGTTDNEFGEFCRTWAEEDCFVPFNGTITLSND